MIERRVGFGIVMDSLFRVAGLLHRCDVWDDVVDRIIHLFAHDQVLRALCQNLMNNYFSRAMLRTNSCERGHVWAKAAALLGQLMEK